MEQIRTPSPAILQFKGNIDGQPKTKPPAKHLVVCSPGMLKKSCLPTSAIFVCSLLDFEAVNRLFLLVIS